MKGVGKVIGRQYLASNIKLGTRFPSFQVLNQSDARPWQLCHFLKSDGRFRIILFAGNLMSERQRQRVQSFGEELAAPESFLRRFTPSKKPIDSTIEVLTVHCAPRQKVELLDLHEIYHPYNPKEGRDYAKVFVDDISYHEGHGEPCRNYGVYKETGCVVIARPDQYVGWIGELEDISDMERYFSEILIPQT